MAINSQAEFEKVLNVSWYTPEQDIENITYVLHATRDTTLWHSDDILVSRVFCRSLKCTRFAALIYKISSTNFISSRMITFNIRTSLTSHYGRYFG